jgi:hypothetical protein
MITVTCIFVIYFALGLLFCQRSGTYCIEILNTYVGGWDILIVGACECIIFSYVRTKDWHGLIAVWKNQIAASSNLA